jgi:hypothetical protein
MLHEEEVRTYAGVACSFVKRMSVQGISRSCDRCGQIGHAADVPGAFVVQQYQLEPVRLAVDTPSRFITAAKRSSRSRLFYYSIACRA